MSSKKELRRSVLARRDEMSEEERARGSLLLTERILGHQWFYRSDTILGFVNYGSEISTEEILREALHLGKKVYLPKVIIHAVEKPEGRNHGGEATAAKSVEYEMKFYQIYDLDELIEGYKGILEPTGTSQEYVYYSADAEKTLMLMPGVAFDCFRNRIGYGKGFYDKYLADKQELQLRTIGVGFQCQMVEEIPAEENDIKPYQVISV